MSCLGSSAVRNIVTIYSESVRVITKAMKKAGVSRFVALTSWCTSGRLITKSFFQCD
ncbi:hypothetical protein HOLleu_31350 [Holothuria leucospilota]|uniref:Uncharacterized protein n=1 Tax=Holothuria leucospilota TaxID=206669 RepID=A0A9Q0YS48_HOLLE|nr:hypothetical protein HOLleu_31350 [Holothuria leucospilota]